MEQSIKIIPASITSNTSDDGIVPEFHTKYYISNIIKTDISRPLYRYVYNSEGKIQYWTISSNLDHIQLYWSNTHRHTKEFVWPNIINNGTHIHIIRLKFKIIFKSIIKLMKIKYRAKQRLYTRKSFLCSGVFRKHVFGPAKRRILNFI